MEGGAGDDTLYGGTGDDRLEGGAGDDVYLFGIGDGHDVIQETETRTDRRNIIRLGEGISMDDIELLSRMIGHMQSDLIIRLKSTGETLTVVGGIHYDVDNLQNSASIQAIEFADGTTWEWPDIIKQPMQLLQGNFSNNGIVPFGGGTIIGNDGNNILYANRQDSVLHGGGGNDEIWGWTGNDVLWGGTGNDVLNGQEGDDTYLFGIGDGHDVIREAETRIDRRNVIRLGNDISVDDIELLARMIGHKQSDLIIRLKSTGETLTVAGGIHCDVNNAQNSASIQAIEFADGTVWEWADIIKQPMHVLQGGFSNNGIVPFGGGFLVGNDGNNILYANHIDSILHGGGGNDELWGYLGNDILWGGTGNDILNGQSGDDTYLFGLGDGHDVIREAETRVGRRNVIRLGQGIGVNDIELFNNYVNVGGFMNLVIRIKSSGETLTVQSGLSDHRTNTNNSSSIQAIEFADGTIWEWEDILAKELHLLDGVINGYASLEGSHLVGTAGDNNLHGRAGNDVLHGGDGNDSLYGNAGDDILWGGAGNDRLEGGAGDDTYLFGRGDGQDTIVESSGNDTLSFLDGIDVTDLWFSRNGNNLVIDIIGSNDKVTVQNWYSHANYQVETISAGGSELASTQMDQLIQALASYGEPAGVDGQWTNEQKEGVNSVISSYWKPTGS